MNCEVFREKILQYLDDDLTLDEKLEMDIHMGQCSECKRIYEEEKEIDDLFRNALNDDSIEFNSSVNKVMSVIDKDKYKSNDSNQKCEVIDFNKKRKSLKGIGYKYLATVASLLIVITGGIYFFKGNMGNKVNDEAGISQAKLEDKASSESATPVPYKVGIKEGKEENLNRSALPKNGEVTESEDKKDTAMIAEVAEESIKFKKEEVSSINEEFSTPWEPISNSKEACITDKGKEAIEEGLSNIAIKDTSENKIEVYKMDSSEYTPKFLERLDDNNLLIIIGFAHGTVARGGNVYILDINTGEARPFYVNDQSGREQVIDITNSDSELDLTIIKYDENMNNYKTYKGIIEKSNREISNILKVYDGDKIVEEIKIK